MIAGLIVAAVIGLVASILVHLPFWVCFAIALGSLFINGVIAEIEDHRIGGFYNPRKTESRRPGDH